MADDKKIEAKVFIFWPYDLFPFVLGAPAERDRDYWVIPSYGMRKLVAASAITTMPVEEGEQLAAKLEVLRAEHAKATRMLMDGFMEEAVRLLPALKRTGPYVQRKRK